MYHAPTPPLAQFLCLLCRLLLIRHFPVNSLAAKKSWDIPLVAESLFPPWCVL
jgi:hypothetical protein